MDKWQSRLRKIFPWGPLFALRSNYEAGYFVKEGELVRKYLRKPEKVLVLGSGNGREGRPISGHGHTIICLDNGLGYLLSGAKLVTEEGIKDMYFVQADTLALPFTKEKFDIVFCTLYPAVRHNKRLLMQEVDRILKPGGIIFFMLTTPYYKAARKDRKAIEDQTFCASVKEAAQEAASAGFTFLEGEIDPLRPEYLFSVLQKSL